MGSESSSVIVLKLEDLDCRCDGCADKVKNSIRHLEGVESVSVDMASNTVTVTGEVDPTRVKEQIEKKTKTKVKIVSQKKPKEVKASTTVLKIRLDCDGCVDRVRKTVWKFKGVESVTLDASKDLVSVKGTMNVNALVSKLKQKFNKREVTVVPPKKDEKSEEKKDVKKEVKSKGADKKQKGNDGGKGEKKKDGDKDTKPKYNQSYHNQDYGILTSELSYANMGYANHGYPTSGPGTWMSSEEDPNYNATCSIM